MSALTKASNSHQNLERTKVGQLGDIVIKSQGLEEVGVEMGQKNITRDSCSFVYSLFFLSMTTSPRTYPCVYCCNHCPAAQKGVSCLSQLDLISFY